MSVQVLSEACGRLIADDLLETALKKAGRTAFSDTSFVEPLERLLQAYEDEADLSRFGRSATRFDTLRCLDNLLTLDAAEEKNPAITARPITAPLFITGLPRSASTFVHMLLGHDPSNAVPRCWELIYPYASQMRFLGRDWRRDWVELQLGIFRLMSPGVAELHPLAADTPQECTDITAHVFQSLRFDTTYHIPSYQAWLDRTGHDAAFRFHRRFLQHLDVQAPGRNWVLKSPDDVFTLDAIRRVYPDAKLVFLHRDPLSVVASCAKLTELLRRPFGRRVDPVAVGRNVADRLVQSGERMASLASEGDILHLQFRDVIGDPMAAVRAIYRHWGRPLSPEGEAGMRQWISVRVHRRRRQRYSLEEFGLEAGALRARFAPYMAAYDVPVEELR